MEIFWDLNQIHSRQQSIVTIGTFDGVHKGHQQIIQHMRKKADAKDLITTLVTFEPHPQLVLQNQGRNPIRILTTIEEKINILSRIGLQRLVVANFNKDFSNIEPADFLKTYLKKKLLLAEIVIGHDHSFGRDRKGDIHLLQDLAQKLKFSIEALPAIKVDGRIVSSTLIRNLIDSGKVATAARLLQRPYKLNGRVIKGDGRGKEIGFPTANIRPLSSYKVLPKAGVYSTIAHIGSKPYHSTTYIGSRATFNLHKNVIEVYIHNFDKNIYDKNIDLQFIEFIRDDRKFESLQLLIEQIGTDIEKSKELFDKTVVN